jgi:hypothetical protein
MAETKAQRQLEQVSERWRKARDRKQEAWQAYIRAKVRHDAVQVQATDRRWRLLRARADELWRDVIHARAAVASEQAPMLALEGAPPPTRDELLEHAQWFAKRIDRFQSDRARRDVARAVRALEQLAELAENPTAGGR